MNKEWTAAGAPILLRIEWNEDLIEWERNNGITNIDSESDDSGETIIDEKIVGHWHYLVMSLYQNDTLEYAHVSVYIPGSKRTRDVSDYVLRNRSCIKKIDFKTQENIDDLIKVYYTN